MDRELIEYLDRFRGELRQELRGFRDELGGEGVIGVDQKVDRLAVEMRTEFQKVDRRFLHLEARIISPRD